MTPTLTISIGRIAAAIGVPNSAENAALIPHMIITCLSLLSKRNSLPNALPILPPICKAAPSRPADPPNKCVISVDTKISGAIRSGSSSSEWIAEMTRFVPVSFSLCRIRYIATIQTPPSGRRKISQLFCVRRTVTSDKAK